MSRFLFGTVLLLIAAGHVIRAATPVPPAPATGTLTAAEEAELAALLENRAAWERSFTLRGAIGARDNLLLSNFAPLRRLFARADFEAFFWRPMRDDWEAVAFVNGNALRYFTPPPEVAGEQEWFGHGEVRWQPLARARFALKADAFFNDSVIDLSETETVRIAAPTRTHGGFLTGAVRLALPGGVAFEPYAQVKRTDYREFPGDYDETIGGARLEWKHGESFSATLSGVERQRRYAERTQYTAGGRPLPGTRLRFRQRDAELKLQTSWSRGGEWSATARAGWLENRDTVSGYFDYDQKRAGLDLAWERGAWSLSFAGTASRLDYLTQTVGAGIAPPPRIADLFETVFRVDRELNAAWLWFAEHTWERHRSNESEFNYRANTVLAGVQRTF